MMVTPPRHVLHVGYPKAGATFLKSWMLAHPQVQFAHGGFGGFGSIEAVAREVRTVPDGVRCYATSSEELVAIQEASINAAAGADDARDVIVRRQEGVCRTLAAVLPESRVLILTRGFVSMIRSSHSQYLKEGGWAWRLDDDGRGFDTGLWLCYLDYVRVASLYESAFGAENVFVLPYELLSDDRPAFLQALERVFGVDAFSFDPGRLNPSLSPGERYWYPRISEGVERVAGLLPGRLGAALSRSYRERLAKSEWVSSVARGLDRFAPHADVAGPDWEAQLRAAFAGRADDLIRRPFFDRFPDEYLFSEAVRHRS